MSDLIFNAAPMPYLRGIRDDSRGQNVREAEQLATHLPHFFIYAEEGPTEPTYIGSSAINTIYGSKTMDPNYPYYNHQTVFLSTALAQGNGAFVQRVLPSDVGPKARILLSVDVNDDAIAQYQRGTDGQFLLDNAGLKIPVMNGATPETKVGTKLKWVVNSWLTTPTVEGFGSVASRVGSMTSSLENESTLYPIMEFEVNFEGAYGNNIAIRLTTPTIGGLEALNSDAVNAIKSYIYRLYVLRRDSADVNPNTVNTVFGDVSMDFAFNPSAIDRRRGIDYSFDSRVIDAYQDLSAPGQETPIYGPFGRVHVYQNNLKEVLARIAANEASLGTLPAAVIDDSDNDDYLYSVNPFTASNYDGVPYYTVAMETVSNGSFRFSQTSQVYASGGSDGTMNDTAFDLLVRNELNNYGSGTWPLLDWAKYPVSAYYDSGFELETKQAFAVPMSKRKDVAVILATHTTGDPQLTASEESSMAMSLNNYFRNFPESTVYGTPVVRAIIAGNSGKLINGIYRGYLPLSLELLNKFAAYMGSGTARWRSTAAFDSEPNNQLSMFDPRSVNVRWKPEVTRYSDWDNGLVWVENYDRKSLFYPAIPTVYNDDSSILNAAVNMWIAVDLEKVALRSWRNLTGNSRLSDDQFLERSDEAIIEDTRGRYDSRVVVRPRTFYTAADKRRGYSWSCEIDMYGSNMRTAASFTIAAKRLADLTTGP